MAIGAFMIGIGVMGALNPDRVEVRTAIAECESTLPRNQTCKYVITAVPKVAE